MRVSVASTVLLAFFRIMKYANPWPPIEPRDERRYHIELTDGTTVEGVEYWAFGGGFQPSETPSGTSKLVEYPLSSVVSFVEANVESTPLSATICSGKYRVRGICFVPTDVEMVVEARSEEEAIRIAKASRWQDHIGANDGDSGAAFDWEPSAEYLPNVERTNREQDQLKQGD